MSSLFQKISPGRSKWFQLFIELFRPTHINPLLVLFNELLFYRRIVLVKDITIDAVGIGFDFLASQNGYSVYPMARHHYDVFFVAVLPMR